jgi:hypothetical protein
MMLSCLRRLVVPLLLGLVLCGCRSGGEPGSSSLASVRIEGFTRDRIQATAKDVFTSEGYSLVSKTPGEMVFQRKGSRSDAFKYGGWFNVGVMLRVKVRFSYAGQGADLLEADVRAVRDANDPMAEDESRILLPSRSRYQHLLDEVRKRLTGK